MKLEIATQSDAESLAELRVSSMRESLEAIGRFDPACIIQEGENSNRKSS